MIKKRESNFELLRIISMLMIVGLHYFHSGMGGAMAYLDNNNVNYYLMHLFESLFIVGVNVFVLISGYFMINKKSVNIKNIVNLYIIMVFYQLIFFIISIFTGNMYFSIKELILVFIPFLGGRRWFVETYMILFVLSPFLNILLNSISEKGYKIIIIIGLILSIWSSFLVSSPILDNGYGITNFIILYSIAGYIRLYYKDKYKPLTYLILYILTSTIVFICSLVPILSGRAWGYIFIFNIIGSICLFLAFKNINIPYNKNINYIAGFTFAVFLIHSDFSLWDIIYKDILLCDKFYESILFIPHMIVSLVLIFIVCVLIDILRKRIFENTVDKYLEKSIFNYEIDPNKQNQFNSL